MTMAQKGKPAEKQETKSGAKPSEMSNGMNAECKMPADFSISLAAKGGTDNLLLNPGGKRIQSMRGYEDTYVDIIDWIVRITHRCWEEKDIGYIYSTYRHNSHVYDDYGLQYGSEKIVADTVHTINAFPDIRLFADEIIWAGDDVSGFHTSHRTVISGHNTGFSRYGPPTGKKALLWWHRQLRRSGKRDLQRVGHIRYRQLDSSAGIRPAGDGAQVRQRN